MDYHKEIEAINRGSLTNNLDLDTPESSHRRNFLLTRANKNSLFPTDQDAENFYKQVIKHQHLATMESEILPFICDYIDVIGNTELLINANKQPCIFCSFHLGSFHSWPALLGRYGVNFTVVISERSYLEQKDELNGKMEALRREKGYTFNFKMINAEDPACVVQMIRELKNNTSLLLFIDGNSGVGGNTRTDNKLIDINFMGRNIFARKGIASVSHVTNTPIVPLLSYRADDERIKQLILDPVWRDENITRDEYVKQTTQSLYDRFSGYLKEYPEQWEGWQYINNCLDMNSLDILPQNQVRSEDQAASKFNKDRYGLLAEKDKYALFDSYTYKLFKITNGLYLFLSGLDKPERPDIRISPELFNDLIVNQVIH